MSRRCSLSKSVFEHDAIANGGRLGWPGRAVRQSCTLYHFANANRAPRYAFSASRTTAEHASRACDRNLSVGIFSGELRPQRASAARSNATVPSMAVDIFQEHTPIPSTLAGALFRFSASCLRPSHFHGQIEFMLVLRGAATMRIGRKLQTAHAGQLIWHLPSVAHEMVRATDDLDARIVLVEPFVAVELAGVCGGTGSSRPATAWVRDLGWLAARRPVVELRRSHLDALLEDCERTFDICWPLVDETPRLKRLLDKAWHATRVEHVALGPNSLVELACGLLLEDASLDRRSVSRLLGVSEGYLSRSFERELGLSFVTQRARIRIGRFAEFVQAAGMKLIDASEAAGFGSYSQLHRTFEQVVGLAPWTYFHRGGRERRALELSPLIQKATSFASAEAVACQ